jgi:hypothetical protein
MIKRFLSIFIILFAFFAPLLSGCMRVALEMTPSLFPNFTSTIFEECDSELAKEAIPSNLKLLEGLLKNDPNNKKILTALTLGFTGYSMLFVEDHDPERASRLYNRAKDYGISALGKKGDLLKTTGGLKKDQVASALKTINKNDLEALLWTTVAWSAWINLNLDQPIALAQLGVSQACLERVMELDGDYFYGLPYILMGVSLSARPPMLGGDPNRASLYFKKALELNQRKFILTQYYYARFYAVRTQNKKLFVELLDEIAQKDAQDLRNVCLINAMIQHKATKLKKMADDLFY